MVFKDFRSTTFYPFQTFWRKTTSTNPWFQARLLSNYITIRMNGYTTEETWGQQLEVGRQNFDRDMVTVYTHWPLFCDLVVITMCIITPWLRNVTLEQAILSRNLVSGTSWRKLASLQVMMIMFSWASGTRDRHESLFLLPCYISTSNIWCLCVIFLLLTVWR